MAGGRHVTRKPRAKLVKIAHFVNLILDRQGPCRDFGRCRGLFHTDHQEWLQNLLPPSFVNWQPERNLHTIACRESRAE